MQRRTSWQRGAATLLSCCLISTAAAQITPPPQGRDVTVDLPRGGQATITLRGFDRNRRPLAFGIDARRSPRHGKLGPVRPTSENTATVTYRHGDDDESTVDEFYYTIRVASGGMAGRARVKVRIIDAPPFLMAPEHLDFGEVVMGDDPPVLELNLANLGGGVIEGLLEVPAPFAILGDPAFRLRRNESTRLAVTFVPERPGIATFRLLPSRESSTFITLRGEALAPLKLAAADKTFRPDQNNHRVLLFGILNQSRERQDITIEIPPGIPVEPLAPLALDPGRETSVTLRIPPEITGAIDTFPVRVAAGPYAELLEVSAPALPPELEIVSAPDFGAVKRGDKAKAELILQNQGGQKAAARLILTEPLRQPRGDVPAFTVEPGERVALPLEMTLRPDQEPPPSVSVEFRDQTLVARVLWQPAITLPTEEKEEPTKRPPPPPPPWQLNQDIRLVDGPALEWTERADWDGYTLQHRRGEDGEWQDYAEPPPRGLLGHWRAFVQRMQDRFFRPIQRHEIEGVNDTVRVGRRNLEDADLEAENFWQLIARPTGTEEPRAVTEVFRIEGDRLVPAPPSPPAPTATAPAATPSPLRDEPVTPIESAGIKSGRREALVQIAIAADPAINGFRLERGAMVSTMDPATELPTAPVFEIFEDSGTVIEYLGLYTAEVDERPLNVFVARITKLPDGSRTFWRLVPLTDAGPRPPTDIFFVDTLPRPPFPWNTVLLTTLGLLLAGILYLRWRINRPRP